VVWRVIGAISRSELLFTARQASGSDPSADVDTGLVASVLRQLVMRRGTNQRVRLLSETMALMGPLLAEPAPNEDPWALIETELEALLSIGDLVLRQPAPRARVMVEPATPSFVRLTPDAPEFMLFGGSYDGRPMLPAKLLDRVEVRGRVRWLAIGHDETSDELAHELEWRGIREIDRSIWVRSPVPSNADLIVGLFSERAKPCARETLSEFEFFDPTTQASYFRGRLRGPDLTRLEALLRSQRWLAARVADAIGGVDYYVLSDVDGEQIAACKIDGSAAEARDQWLLVAAALSNLAVGGGGSRFRAVVSADEVFLYFPPPSWLERMLSLGCPRPRSRGALRVDAFTTKAAFDLVAESMKSVLFVEIERG
jgi:hypothetical protein